MARISPEYEIETVGQYNLGSSVGTGTQGVYIPADATPEERWEKIQKIRAAIDKTTR